MPQQFSRNGGAKNANGVCVRGYVCIQNKLCSPDNLVITDGRGTINQYGSTFEYNVAIKKGVCDDIEYVCCKEQPLLDLKLMTLTQKNQLLANKTIDGFCKKGFNCIQHNLCSPDNVVITDGRGTINQYGSTFEENVAIKKGVCDDPEFGCCEVPNLVDLCPEGFEEVEMNQCPHDKKLHSNYGIVFERRFAIGTECCIKEKVQQCGKRYIGGIDPVFQLSNDSYAEFGEFQWTVLILNPENNDFLASGSLITLSVVLTAAHSVNGLLPSSIKVRGGVWDTSLKAIYQHQDRNVIEVVQHPDFQNHNSFNDIAILFLGEPFYNGVTEMSPTPYIGTICLPPPGLSFDNNRCIVTGFGKTAFTLKSKYQRVLKKIELPFLPQQECQDRFRKNGLGPYFQLNKSFVCAGGESGNNACVGDGGSALVCPIPDTTDRYYQVGIVSWGLACSKTVPVAYANIQYLRSWIDEVLLKHKIDSSPFSFDAT